MPSNLNDFKKRLDALERAGLRRRQRELVRTRFPALLLEGKELLDFCSNNYLGLADNPEFLSGVRRRCLDLPVGATGSRLLSGEHQVQRELEARFAAFKGMERCLLFPSGYQANLSAIAGLATQDDVIYLDKYSHASLIDGAKLSGAKIRVFKHLDYDNLEELLQKPAGKQFVLTDGVFSMDGDLADLPKLAALREKYGFLLLLDDAHGSGVIGKTGKGIQEHFNLLGAIDVLTGTLSKAFGGQGGFVLGDGILIETVLNQGRGFIYSTGISPWLCAAGIEALDWIEKGERLQLLRERQKFFLEKASQTLPHLKKSFPSPLSKTAEEEFSASAIYPLMIGAEEKALSSAQTLLLKGFFLPAIRYPTVPKGSARLRISLSAGHSKKMIETLLDAVGTLLSEMKVGR